MMIGMLFYDRWKKIKMKLSEVYDMLNDKSDKQPLQKLLSYQGLFNNFTMTYMV